MFNIQKLPLMASILAGLVVVLGITSYIFDQLLLLIGAAIVLGGLYVICVTSYVALSATISDQNEKIIRLTELSKVNSELQKKNDVIKSSDALLPLLEKCATLAKYNIKYEIHKQENKIVAYLPMSVYTRMSVAKALVPGVEYKIEGSDIVLKQS